MVKKLPVLLRGNISTKNKNINGVIILLFCKEVLKNISYRTIYNAIKKYLVTTKKPKILSQLKFLSNNYEGAYYIQILSLYLYYLLHDNKNENF